MTSNRRTKLPVAWWLLFLQALVVRFVKVDDDWKQAVQTVAARGPVVFVLRNRSLIDFLCLRGLCQKLGLSPVGFVAGLRPLHFLPLWLWWRGLFGWHDKWLRRYVDETVASGGTGIVFLRKPSWGRDRGSVAVQDDGIRLTVSAQGQCGVPVQILPMVFLWGEHAMRRLPASFYFLFGSNEYPRLLRSLWLLVRRRSVHKLLAAQPIDLARTRTQRASDDSPLTGIAKSHVHRRIESLRRKHLGGLTKPSSRLVHELLGSPRLREELDKIAEQDGIPKQDIAPRALGIVKKMATDFKPPIITLLAAVMLFVWKRIYTGIDVGKDDIERIRDAVSKGACLILPTHRSHIDYLVLSQVMLDHNIMLPHIAAGQNLSFWPLGPVFRSSGAFFIRRTFINDRFYAAIVNAYLRFLIKSGYAVEIFIEGSRSRTGKLLRPKLGMLDMALRAIAVLPRVDVRILPTFIGYEEVIEEKSYVQESRGKQKRDENIKGLIGTSKVLLRRYGRLYLRAGESFSVSQVLRDLGIDREQLDKTAVRRDVALEIATRTYHQIHAMTVATSTAVLSTALLTRKSPRVEHEELRKDCLFWTEVLQAAGATMSQSLAAWKQEEVGETRFNSDLFSRALRAYVGRGRLRRESRKASSPRYHLVGSQRLAMDYYKNNIMHFLVPLSIACAACLRRPQQRATLGEIAADFCLSSQLYHWEFMIHRHRPCEEGADPQEPGVLAQQAVQVLERLKIVGKDGNAVVPVEPLRAQLIADALRCFHEVYYAALVSVKERSEGRGQGADSTRRARALAEELLRQKRFEKPEAMSRSNLQNAFEACKELHLSRPPAGEKPFGSGQLGDELLQYLSSILWPNDSAAR
ncbi:MAG: 1-acyl-sn-glycerol-3-phosphate acyltransferase [Myxococcota bacterium]|jgi:glycerol-3-phosphate O-acyltransferase|nr:1-acyl-sn-glycerol-3-phosphate acyltransferase [Myxococcota bacterium]